MIYLGLGNSSRGFGGDCTADEGDGAGSLGVEGVDLLADFSGHCYAGYDHSSNQRQMSPVTSALPRPDDVGFSDGSRARAVRCVDYRSPPTNNGDEESTSILTASHTVGEDFDRNSPRETIHHNSTRHQKRQLPSLADMSSIVSSSKRSRGHRRGDSGSGGDYCIDGTTAGDGMLPSPLAVWNMSPPLEPARIQSIRPNCIGSSSSTRPAMSGASTGAHSNTQHASFTIGYKHHDLEQHHRGRSSSRGELLKTTSIATSNSPRRWTTSIRGRQDAPSAFTTTLAGASLASARTASSLSWSRASYQPRLVSAAAPSGTYDPLLEARPGQPKLVHSALIAVSSRPRTMMSPPNAATDSADVSWDIKSGWRGFRVRGNDGFSRRGGNDGGGGGGGGGNICRDNGTDSSFRFIDNRGGDNFGTFTAVEGDVSSDRLDACFLRELVPQLMIQQKNQGRNRPEGTRRV